MRAPRGHDPRATGDVIRGMLLLEKAAHYRQAARDLDAIAEDFEREAREGQEAAHWQAEADRELERAARRRRAA